MNETHKSEADEMKRGVAYKDNYVTRRLAGT